MAPPFSRARSETHLEKNRMTLTAHQQLDDLARRVGRLIPDRRNPGRFFEERSEIAYLIRKVSLPAPSQEPQQALARMKDRLSFLRVDVNLLRQKVKRLQKELARKRRKRRSTSNANQLTLTFI